MIDEHLEQAGAIRVTKMGKRTLRQVTCSQTSKLGKKGISGLRRRGNGSWRQGDLHQNFAIWIEDVKLDGKSLGKVFDADTSGRYVSEVFSQI
jgi:hypothetical protein